MICRPDTNAHWPLPWQTVVGRQEQVGVPLQLAGKSAQNGEGGVHGGGVHPGPEPGPCGQSAW